VSIVRLVRTLSCEQQMFNVFFDLDSLKTVKPKDISDMRTFRDLTTLRVREY